MARRGDVETVQLRANIEGQLNRLMTQLSDLEEMKEEIKKLNDSELIQLYPSLIKELKDRKIIRTNNIVGDLGEYFAVKIFNENSNLPKLQMAPTSTENVDALSTKGKRYAIKSTSSRMT